MGCIFYVSIFLLGSDHNYAKFVALGSFNLGSDTISHRLCFPIISKAFQTHNSEEGRQEVKFKVKLVQCEL